MVPIVIYHGLEKWDITFDQGRFANLEFFDLCRMPDEQIKGTTILKIVLLTLKYIQSEELATKIDTLFELFKELQNDPETKEYVQSFSHYVEHASRKELRDMLGKKIALFFSDEELEDSSVVRMLEERGRQKGREEGIDIGEKKGIDIGEKKGIDIGAESAKLILTTSKTDEEIYQETGLSVLQIRELRKKLKR
jgi:predicted transposase YdaD